MINTINNSQHYEQIFQQPNNKSTKSSFIPSPQYHHHQIDHFYNNNNTTNRKHNSNKFNEVFPQKLSRIQKNPIINNTLKQFQHKNQIEKQNLQHIQNNSKIPRVSQHQNHVYNNKSTNNESRNKIKSTYRKQQQQSHYYTKIGNNLPKENENFQNNGRIYKENIHEKHQQHKNNLHLNKHQILNRNNENLLDEIENEYDYIYETIPENYLIDQSIKMEKYDELWMDKSVQKFDKDKQKLTEITKFKYNNRNDKNNLKCTTTSDIMSTPKYYARIAQKITENLTSKNHSFDFAMSLNRNGGFCGALQRAPPPMPPGLIRRLSNKENYGLGKVKVMLRVSDHNNINDTTKHFMSVDKKKRQITLTDSSAINTISTMSQDRALMVAAPKMFAFDGIFTADDPQYDVCSSSLSEVIPAVLEGSDACFLAIGYPNSGQSKTMFGELTSSNELGVISCAISWLYKGINDRRQKTGSRFSVRVSALGISARKSDSSAKDLLAAYATELDDSPGVYFREDFLGGPTELRAPTAERAALFLDAALAVRPKSDLDPAIIFTLHVYQYSLSRKGGVAGGRSRLHFIDLGGCANRNGGLPLSGIGNIILAILNGQRHLPNKDHPLTPLLKDCLGPLTCHVTILAHIKYIQAYTDALTTIQLASRIHRMRRRRQRFPISTEKNIINKTGPDPSSSDMSADTVIYMGPSDDATDGEHPPLYLPSLSEGDNQCPVNKTLKIPVVEKQISIPKVSGPIISNRIDNRTTQLLSDSLTLKSDLVNNVPKECTTQKDLPFQRPAPCGASAIPNIVDNQFKVFEEEQWIDGPRLSRAKIAEARHMLREINHVKNCETWIDGPKTTNLQHSTKQISAKPELNKLKHHSAKILNNGKFLTSVKNNSNHLVAQSYGFMDSHKKTMIRQWVENQSSHIFQPAEQQFNKFEKETSLVTSQIIEILNPSVQVDLVTLNSNLNENEIKSSTFSVNDDKINLRSLSTGHSLKRENSENYSLERSEIPSPLPLIKPLGSREVSIESVNRILSIHVSHESMEIKNTERNKMLDCGLQVSEDDISRSMEEHPLAALSHGNISTVSSFNIGDTFSDCAIGDKTRNQFDQLARLREIFTSQLAMAELIPHSQTGSVYSEPVFRFDTENHSVYSEPVQQPSSPRCSSCRQSLNLSKSSETSSVPSLKGIMEIANMNEYSSLRHPDGASDPNLQKSKTALSDVNPTILENNIESHLFVNPLVPLNTTDAYDSGHDCSTPRTSKYSAISRRAESGYHSVATGRDSDELSLASASIVKHQHNNKNTLTNKKKRQDKSLCNWLRSPFTCTHPETEGEISDF